MVLRKKRSELAPKSMGYFSPTTAAVFFQIGSDFCCGMKVSK